MPEIRNISGAFFLLFSLNIKFLVNSKTYIYHNTHYKSSPYRSNDIPIYHSRTDNAQPLE